MKSPQLNPIEWCRNQVFSNLQKTFTKVNKLEVQLGLTKGEAFLSAVSFESAALQFQSN